MYQESINVEKILLQLDNTLYKGNKLFMNSFIQFGKIE